MKKLLLILLGLVLSINCSVYGQQTFPQNGVYDEREGLFAFTNAVIYQSYNQKLDNATLLVRKGKIQSVGENVDIPSEAVVFDLKGKTIYPSFIDLYTDYGMPEVKSPERNRGPQMLSKKEGAYSWNQALKPEFRAHQGFEVDSKAAKELLKNGFGVVMTHQMDGISRGSAALVDLSEKNEHEVILKEKAAHHLSFSKGNSTQNYPSSLMGCIALLRQTYYDAAWYKTQREETNISLEAWNEVQDLPQVFEVRNKLEALRAAKIGQEFGIKYLIKGSGDEYQRLEALQQTGSAFILPVDFPDAYDVEDPYEAQQVTLTQLKHWEMAPANASMMAAAGIDFALTAHGLKKKSDFRNNLIKAIEAGLSEEMALKALTHTPAQMIGGGDLVGSLEPGKYANFFIASGKYFDKETKIYQHWVNGKVEQFADLDLPWGLGEYELVVDGKPLRLLLREDAEKPKMKIRINDTTEIDVSYKYSKGLLTLSYTPTGAKEKVRLSGTIQTKKWSGEGQGTDGNWLAWKAAYKGPLKEDTKNKKKRTKKTANEATEEIGKVTYPFTAYGWERKPAQENYLIKNATVWTNEAEGILENTDVIIRDGKIAEIGQNLSDRSAILIEGRGMHLTPGIIDEHTHIAVSRGVNEGTQASSAEVRIGDVINSEDINIYRQLAGGVTTAQVLHGSANPIGGQSAIIKMRWGYAPEDLKFEGADGFIKFALGENVKQSNRSREYRVRFPQTRMGVEQVYMDHFTRAREYGDLKKSGKPYRKDLELEALLEILNSERFITCHSYVQSEINMLMKVAEHFDFRINTFTHILEGYKVADKMAEHGAGGSSFSDWWAYKFEVYEAIPYNGALMHNQGVTVAFNSDDSEMARRLNQEAAKAVLFGGVPEEEALKFVTLNPAKLLHIDDRVGSIKVGKDADVVLWSDNPLSIYAKAQKTFVDGIKFFDREADLKLRAIVQAERTRLIQKMLTVKQNGGRTRPAAMRRTFSDYHCEDVEDEMGN